MDIVTLTTCHNRRECTVAALSDLFQQKLSGSVTLSHVIVDDGSTDGTIDAISQHFPAVEIMEGDGNLFWAGGMRYGWEQSVSKKTFDYLFVYNDDVRFDDTAIRDLLKSAERARNNHSKPFVVVGSFRDAGGTMTTYGGRRRSSRWHPLKFAHIIEPDGTVQRADTFNMNGALLSASALKEVGFLSDFFIHSGADFEYGLKLNKAGGAVYVAEKHIGTCDLNVAKQPTDEFSITLRQRLRLLSDFKREPFRQRVQYYRRHGGLFWPLFWIAPYLTVWIRHIWYSTARMIGFHQSSSGSR